METSHKYPNPPLREAMLVIQMTFGSGNGMEAARLFSETLKGEYPDRKPVYAEGTVEDSIDGRPNPLLPHQPIRYVCREPDNKSVVQVGATEFDFSCLPPYPGFETFLGESRRIWERFRETSPEVTIDRLALRYLNVIELPNPVGEISDWLTVGPTIPSAFPQTVAGLYLQLELPFPDRLTRLLVTEAMGEVTSESVQTVLLELDLMREDSVPQSDEEMWAYFGSLREIKNVVFEACLTPRTRELFQ